MDSLLVFVVGAKTWEDKKTGEIRGAIDVVKCGEDEQRVGAGVENMMVPGGIAEAMKMELSKGGAAVYELGREFEQFGKNFYPKIKTAKKTNHKFAFGPRGVSLSQ